MGLGDEHASFPECFCRDSGKEIALLLKKKFSLIYLFCEEAVHKRDFRVVRVFNTLWIQGLCEIRVLQTLLFLFRLVHLFSVYIGLNQDCRDLSEFFFFTFMSICHLEFIFVCE